MPQRLRTVRRVRSALVVALVVAFVGAIGPVPLSTGPGPAGAADHASPPAVDPRDATIPQNSVSAFGSAEAAVPGATLTGLVAGIVGIASTPDGGVFAFGDAPFTGSSGGAVRKSSAVGIAGRPGGYWIAFGEHRMPSILPAITQYVAGRSDNVTVAVEDLDRGAVLQYRPGAIDNTASTLKVDILATLLARAQAEGRFLTAVEQSLAVPMIEESLDSAAATLWEELGPSSVGALERQAGRTSTVPAADGVWGTTTTTALDRVDMAKLLAEPNGVLDDQSRAYVLDLMEHITPSQDWGATGGVPPDVTVALTNVFAEFDGWQINTEGWVDGDGRDYLIGVPTNGNASEGYGIDTVNAISSIAWQGMGN